MGAHGESRHLEGGPARWLGRGALLLALTLVAALIPDARAGAPALVDIRDSKYLPSTITVPVGTTVRWTNHDEETHTVTGTAGGFGSLGLDLDESYTYTFTAPGTYPYGCDLHPFMSGTVVVE